jgi:histidinol-phosphatase (PHP family)
MTGGVFDIIDYHVHPDFSIDAEAHSIEAYCRRAVEIGLRGICFTPHFEADPERRSRDGVVRLRGRLHPMDDPVWLEEYFREIETVRRRYGNRLMIGAGLEVGYEYGQEELFARVLETYPFDYVIGSVHCLEHVAISSSEESGRYFRDKTPEQVAADYFRKLAALVDSGLFDSVGHLDLYRRHGWRYLGRAMDTLHEGWVEPILARMADRGLGLEINSSSIRLGHAECIPGLDLSRLARDHGVRYFTVGSDAHRLSDLASGLDKALAQLAKLKLGVATFLRREVVALDKPRIPNLK